MKRFENSDWLVLNSLIYKIYTTRDFELMRSEFLEQLRLVLDFEETCFMDSSGIGVIIGRSRKMKFLDGELVVCGVTPRIERIFEASGLYKIVKVRE